MDRTGKRERDAAFTAFVEQATPSLLRTAWLLTGDHDAAHDLVQAALVRTYVAWPRVRPETALAYSRRILVNQRTDRWRRHGLHGNVDRTCQGNHDLRPERIHQPHSW